MTQGSNSIDCYGEVKMGGKVCIGFGNMNGTSDLIFPLSDHLALGVSASCLLLISGLPHYFLSASSVLLMLL